MATTVAASSVAPASLSSRVEIGNASAKAARSLSMPQAAPRTVKAAVTVCAQQQDDASVQSRRSMLSLLAASVAAGALVSDAKAVAPIQLGGPPPPIGGLPGTDSADQARDTGAPLKERFYLQPLSPEEAIVRAKESAAQIVAVKGLIEKKAWPYVQNDLRSKAGYLRFDLNTVIAAKPKDEKKALTSLANELYDSIADLDWAARKKSTEAAEKSYEKTVKLLDAVLSKAS